jgi:hypothetical protein
MGVPSGREGAVENTTADVKAAEFQGRYGGQYVARIDDEVVASAETYRELSQQLDRMGVRWTDLVIEFVEPATSVSVY